jgi:hypothetical protein
LTDGCVHKDQRLQPQGQSLIRPRFEIGKICGRLRLRQHGSVTQATCKQARRRRPVAGHGMSCSRNARNSHERVQERHKRGLAQVQYAGKRGKLGRCLGGRLIAHCILFDPITSSPARTRTAFATHHLPALLPDLYPSAILGHAPPPALISPALPLPA